MVPVEIVYTEKTGLSLDCIGLHNSFQFFSFSSSKLGMLGGHWDISRRNHFTHVYAIPSAHWDTTTECFSMGSSPSGQEANRTKRLRWPQTKRKKKKNKQKKNIPSVTSLECCCCCVDKEIHIQRVLKVSSCCRLHIDHIFSEIIH